jgi:hypothetical protein
LNLTAVLGLEVDGNIVRQAHVDPMTTLTIPTSDRFIHSNMLGRRKHSPTVPIASGYKVMHGLPTIPNSAEFPLRLWLIAETNARGYLIETVARHTCLSKLWFRDVLASRTRLPHIVTLAESRHEHQYAEELQELADGDVCAFFLQQEDVR